jgi:hypothetical protein
MYGVPADLDLTFLHGATLIQVCIGQYEVQLHFHPVGSISIEGRWELLDAPGLRIDGSANGSKTATSHLQRLLGEQIVASEVRAPLWFALQFSGGEVLRVYDDSAEYESFSIHPVNVFV